MDTKAQGARHGYTAPCVRCRAVLPAVTADASAAVSSGSPAFVSMVETADFGNGHDRSEFRWLSRSRFRGVFGQREMRPGLVVIPDKRLYMPV